MNPHTRGKVDCRREEGHAPPPPEPHRACQRTERENSFRRQPGGNGRGSPSFGPSPPTSVSGSVSVRPVPLQSSRIFASVLPVAVSVRHVRHSADVTQDRCRSENESGLLL